MGLRSIALAVAAYRKLTDKEKEVFKSETRARRRKKKATRKKRVSKKVAEPKQWKAGGRKKRQPPPDQFPPQDPTRVADPLSNIHTE